MQWLVENVRNVGAAAFERKPVARAVENHHEKVPLQGQQESPPGRRAQQTLKKVRAETLWRV